jgi:LDH2 family malate/lactate/ureidoglycolate dehydrogenase
MIPIKRLTEFIVALTKKAGLPEEQALILAQTLIDADLKGIDTHGLLRLPIYVKRMETGVINIDDPVEVVKEKGVIHLLDARNGLGQVACVRGMELAMTKAEQFGLGACGVFNSNHCGALGYYAELAAQKKMIGLMTTNVFPLMAPVGGKEKVIGNNPLAVSIPRSDGLPVTYDAATSTISYGKVLIFLRRGEDLPLGWALDDQGMPTGDPEEVIAQRGSLTPVGAHKGFGLAFILEILSGVLTGAGFGRQLRSLYDAEQLSGIGQFLLAINIEFFMELELFFTRLEAWIREVKGSSPALETKEIFIPGESSQRNKAKNLKTGLLYDNTLLNELNLLAHRYAISPLRQEEISA